MLLAGPVWRGATVIGSPQWEKLMIDGGITIPERTYLVCPLLVPF